MEVLLAVLCFQCALHFLLSLFAHLIYTLNLSSQFKFFYLSSHPIDGHLPFVLQTVFGATKNGTIHVWDLRGGRASAAFQSHNEVGLGV
jgi:hypothetical protein